MNEGDRVRSIRSRALGTVIAGRHVPIGWGDTLIPVHWDGRPYPGNFRESEMEVVSPLEELAEQAE